jgi:hypothetical protein
MQNINIVYDMSGEMSGDGLRASIGLSQRGAPHSIDGASGNFGGDRLCTARPVGPRRAANTACDIDNAYTICLTPRI